jgi:hypothetical protein
MNNSPEGYGTLVVCPTGKGTSEIRSNPRLSLRGRRIWIADAHRDDGKRFIVRADEIACLPDERHITGLRRTTGITDTDRVCTGHLDVHQSQPVDPHDVGSRCESVSGGGGRGGERFEAEPFDDAAGNM